MENDDFVDGYLSYVEENKAKFTWNPLTPFTIYGDEECDPNKFFAEVKREGAGSLYKLVRAALIQLTNERVCNIPDHICRKSEQRRTNGP